MVPCPFILPRTRLRRKQSFHYQALEHLFREYLEKKTSTEDVKCDENHASGTTEMQKKVIYFR